MTADDVLEESQLTHYNAFVSLNNNSRGLVFLLYTNVCLLLL